MKHFTSRKIILAGILLIINAISFSQHLQKVHSFVKEYHEVAWYDEQRDLWEKELNKKPKDEEAWSNYYNAIRTASVLKGWKAADDSLTEQTLRKMGKTIPNSFTYNYYKGAKLGIWNPNSWSYIDKAYAIKPNDPLILDAKVIRAEMDNALVFRKELNQKWFALNDMSPGLLQYNYNALACLAPNAILFTSGDNDTYPAWMVQDVFDFRKDVVIINLSMMGMKEYRKVIYQRTGISLSKEQEDAITINEPFHLEDADLKRKLFIKTIAENANGKPVYVGLTVGTPPAVKLIEDKLYIIGLASLYSEKKIDNTALIRKNFERNLLLDDLKAKFVNDKNQTNVDWCNQNFLPSMILLYQHYKASDESNKAAEIKALAMKIAEKSDQKEAIMKQLTSSN
jgi:hypothetical protein